MNESNHDLRNQATPIRVLVADDHIVTRHGLSMLCHNAEGIEVVAEAADGDQAITLVEEWLPDVVLMDVDMPRCDGIEATKRIHRDHPTVEVIILTDHEDAETIFEAIKAGAMGYLPKSATLEEIHSAIKIVADGGAVFDPAHAVQAFKLLDQFVRWDTKARSGPAEYDLLTPRELTILVDVMDGMTVTQIAAARRISRRTVSAHMSNIYRKLHVNNRVDAVRYARLAYPATPLPAA
jgi:DNA-binding NarL/FixJ family response regulator